MLQSNLFLGKTARTLLTLQLRSTAQACLHLICVCWIPLPCYWYRPTLVSSVLSSTAFPNSRFLGLYPPSLNYSLASLVNSQFYFSLGFSITWVLHKTCSAIFCSVFSFAITILIFHTHLTAKFSFCLCTTHHLRFLMYAFCAVPDIWNWFCIALWLINSQFSSKSQLKIYLLACACIS